MTVDQHNANPVPGLKCWRGTLRFSQTALTAYLTAVGGGHPVHQCTERAHRAGFSDVPVPGPLISGAAIAHLGSGMQDSSLQMISQHTRHSLPVLLGDVVRFEWSLTEQRPLRTRGHEVVLEGNGWLDQTRLAVHIKLLMRVMDDGPSAT